MGRRRTPSIEYFVLTGWLTHARAGSNCKEQAPPGERRVPRHQNNAPDYGKERSIDYGVRRFSRHESFHQRYGERLQRLPRVIC